MICARRPAQIVSVSAIDHSDSYEVVIGVGGRQECLSIEASMLEVLRRDLIALGFEEEARRVGNDAAHLSDLSISVCARLSGGEGISG